MAAVESTQNFDVVAILDAWEWELTTAKDELSQIIDEMHAEIPPPVKKPWASVLIINRVGEYLARQDRRWRDQ